MPQKGTYAAYQQVRPIESDLGDIAMKAGEIRRQQERELEAKRVTEVKEIKAQKQRISDGFKKSYSELTQVVTGTKSLTEAMSRGVGAARDLLGETYKQIERDPSLYDDVNTSMKISNASNFSKNLKLISERYTEYAMRVGTGMQDGTLSEWNNNTLNDLNSIFKDGNLDVSIDPDSGLPIAIFAKQDDDGNNIYDKDGELVMERMNLLEILDGRGLQDTPAKFDLVKHAKAAGKDLGDRIQKTETGSFTTREIQTFSTIEPEVRKLAKGLIGNADNPTDVAKSIWSDSLGRAKPPDGIFTAPEMKQIEDAYVAATKPYYNEIDRTKTDYSAQTSAAKAAKADKDKKEKPGLQLREYEDGKPVTASRVQVMNNGKNETGWSFSLPRKEGKIRDVKITKGEEELKVDNIFLTEDGRILYSGVLARKTPAGATYQEKKKAAGADKTATWGGNNEIEVSKLNDLARAFGYPNAKALKKGLTSLSTGGTTKKTIENF